MPKHLKNYILAGVLFIVGLGLGFLAGKNTIPATVIEEEIKKTLSNDLYSSQTAFIRGKITRIDSKNLTVANLTTNASGELTISDHIVITKPGSKQPSSDLSALETEKEALISLEMKGGQYEVTAIQYVNPAPTLPPSNIKPVQSVPNP